MSSVKVGNKQLTIGKAGGALLCSMLLFCFCSFGQQKDDPINDQELQEKIENVAENTTEDVDVSTLLDKLSYYSEHPLNLNEASREELEDLLLLDELQIQALQNHIRDNGKLIALEELQSVDGFDQETINKILPYVTIGNINTAPKITFKKLLTDGKSNFFVRGQQVLENQKGFSDTLPDKSRYLGDPLKLYSRFRYTYGNRISLGIVGEKDAGEQFFKGTQPGGFDYYSAHFFYRGSNILKSLAIGDYYVQYGQGLTLYSGLAFGKSSDVMNIKKNARGILPYSSVDENAFMRGGAAAFGIKDFQLDVFYSTHKIDANVVSTTDTAITEDNITVSSFQEGGFHRDSSEIKDKHTLSETLYGGHLQYKKRNFGIGATAYKTEFGNALIKDVQPYNRFQFQGKENTNAGIDYNYLFRNINFFGEAGRSENGGMAFLNGALVNLDARVAVSLLHRHFDKDYQALLANAVAENSTVANEDGFLTGIVVKPTPKFNLSAYYDRFRFPWLRYQVDAPTEGREYLAQLTFTPNKKFETYFRIKQQTKPENISGDEFFISQLQDVKQTNYRYSIRYPVSNSVTLTNRVEYVTLTKGDNAPAKGFMVYQDVNYKPLKSRFSFSARYVLFQTDNYDTRIYAYENDVLYSYSIPSYYYKGQRFYINVKYRIIRGIDVWLRYARTVYDGQKTISSGLDEIDTNHKTEVKAQVRFQF
jgi:hypothetical protein